jgi:uncharacterized membrane protein YtjA (UPF0391 family)
MQPGGAGGVLHAVETPEEPAAMLTWTIVFLIVALIAGALGFGGVASTASGIAKVLFFIFLVLFVVSLIGGGVVAF